MPDLHFETPGYPYHQATPTFAEDLVIPWEGTRLVKAVQGAAPKIKAGQDVRLLARVSEGLEQRQKLQKQIEDILSRAGADKRRLHVEVLCAFKPGLSWLMDEIAPDLQGKGASAIQIEFARDVDPSGTRTMYSPSRWLHELYPVDEMLALKLKMPREKITFSMFERGQGGPTYRVHATDAAGAQLLSREFTVPTVMQPYNGVIKSYEQVEVDTGWVRLDVGSEKVLDQRIMTDLEMFWDHYQNKTLPDLYQFVMSQVHGTLREEFAPPFDTLKMDIHLSEPEYPIAGVDHERVSALEALQEDTFYSTANFVEMWGRLETGQQINHIGRVIPIVHPPAADEGKDGHVRIEFYGKQAPNPLVRLTWTDAQGKAHERERAISVITGEMMPRLIQAHARAGSDAIETLTWLLAADYKQDDFQKWSKLERRDQVDRTIFSVDKASGELHWLEQMHAAGVYRDSIAYPHVRKMAMEFELPLEINKETLPAERSYVSWSVPAPATPRPMISDYAGQVTHTPIVQWDEAINSAENAGILARFSTFPGVTVYWMGRSYLGQNIWAADIMLPSPSVLHSWAKETTLKASVVYSGRQHANEVSSTSHIDKLAEQLLTDPSVRPNLKQVNVVIHPITNPDGTELSVILAKITPDNMLHPGYHGSLSADVASNQTDVDPVYPESRTRKQLADAWLPDAFLNPHGYPSHEWVQPFSEYTGWVTNRQGANPSRANWIARGWFTSLGYFRDPDLPVQQTGGVHAPGPDRRGGTRRARIAGARNEYGRPVPALGARLAARRCRRCCRRRHHHEHGAEGDGAQRRWARWSTGERRDWRSVARHHVGCRVHRGSRRDRSRRLHETPRVGRPGIRQGASALPRERHASHHADRTRCARRRAAENRPGAADPARVSESAADGSSQLRTSGGVEVTCDGSVRRRPASRGL